MEGVGVSFLFESNDALVQLLNFFLLAEQLILFFLDLLLFVQDLLEDLLVAELSPLHFFLVHIPLSLQLLDEGAVLSLAFFLLVQLVLELSQAFTYPFTEVFELLAGGVQFVDLITHLLDACIERVVFGTLAGKQISCCREFLFFKPH